MRIQNKLNASLRLRCAFRGAALAVTVFVGVQQRAVAQSCAGESFTYAKELSAKTQGVGECSDLNDFAKGTADIANAQKAAAIQVLYANTKIFAQYCIAGGCAVDYKFAAYDGMGGVAWDKDSGECYEVDSFGNITDEVDESACQDQHGCGAQVETGVVELTLTCLGDDVVIVTPGSGPHTGAGTGTSTGTTPTSPGGDDEPEPTPPPKKKPPLTQPDHCLLGSDQYCSGNFVGGACGPNKFGTCQGDPCQCIENPDNGNQGV